MNISKAILEALAAAILAAGCGVKSGKAQHTEPLKVVRAANPLTVVLAYEPGSTRTDQEILQRQKQIRAGKQVEIALERLGWLYVAKARETFDAGFYKLAEQCALALDRGGDASSLTEKHGDEGVAATRAAAMLLRAHVLQNLHRF